MSNTLRIAYIPVEILVGVMIYWTLLGGMYSVSVWTIVGLGYITFLIYIIIAGAIETKTQRRKKIKENANNSIRKILNIKKEKQVYRFYGGKQV